jgi:hypothetical protein
MVEDRLLLCEDTASEETRLMQAGLDRGVPAPAGGTLPAAEQVPACLPRPRHHDRDHDRDDDHDHHDHDD